MISNRTLLAVFFPPSCGMNGALTTLSDLTRGAYAKPRFASRSEAARTILRANLEPVVPGRGNAAKRRANA